MSCFFYERRSLKTIQVRPGILTRSAALIAALNQGSVGFNTGAGGNRYPKRWSSPEAGL